MDKNILKTCLFWLHKSGGGDPIDNLKLLKGKGVHYFCCNICTKTDAMLSQFKEAFKKSKFIQTKKLTDAKFLAQTVLQTLTSATLQSYQASGAGGAGLAKLSQVSNVSSAVNSEDDERTSLPEPDEAVWKPVSLMSWDSKSTQKLQISSGIPLEKTVQVTQRSPALYGDFPKAYECRIDEEPFADGATRWAYYGQIKRSNGEWEGWVFKRFKRLADRSWSHHTRTNYLEQISASEIAIFFAEQWNARKPADCNNIEFLPNFVGGVEQKATGAHDQWCEWYCIEPLLPEDSKFVKFNNNIGMWDAALADETILRFAKFTFDVSGGYMMLADLQGVKTKDGYTLTDPVVLCKDKDRFLPTNLGPKVMKCNSLMITTLLQNLLKDKGEK